MSAVKIEYSMSSTNHFETDDLFGSIFQPIETKATLLECPECMEGVLKPVFISLEEYMFICKEKHNRGTGSKSRDVSTLASNPNQCCLP